MKICKNCNRKKIENEINIIFSYDKFDNIWRKTFNNINEVHNINFWNGNNFFFAKCSLKTPDIFWQFYIRAFELMKQTKGIKRN